MSYGSRYKLLNGGVLRGRKLRAELSFLILSALLPPLTDLKKHDPNFYKC